MPPQRQKPPSPGTGNEGLLFAWLVVIVVLLNNTLWLVYPVRTRSQRLREVSKKMPPLIKLAALFAITAVAEILGCYLPWLVLKNGRSAWLLVPAACSLSLFAWLLTLHPTAAGRTYAAYGGMYIAVALLWLRFVDGVALTRWDVAGAVLALVGVGVIALQPLR